MLPGVQSKYVVVQCSKFEVYWLMYFTVVIGS